MTDILNMPNLSLHNSEANALELLENPEKIFTDSSVWIMNKWLDLSSKYTPPRLQWGLITSIFPMLISLFPILISFFSYDNFYISYANYYVVFFNYLWQMELIKDLLIVYAGD